MTEEAKERVQDVITRWWESYEDDLEGLAIAVRAQYLIPWCDEVDATFVCNNGEWLVSDEDALPRWLREILEFPLPGLGIEFALLMKGYAPQPQVEPMANAAFDIELGDVTSGDVTWPGVVIQVDTRGIVLMDPSRPQSVLHALVAQGVLEYDILEGKGVFLYPWKGKEA